MEKKKNELIPFTKSVWKGIEITHRTDRVNIKLNVNLKRPDEKEIKKRAEEIVKSVKDSEIVRLSLKTGKLILKVHEGTDIIALVNSLSQHKGVLYAEPDLVGKTCVTPNDPKYTQQWGPKKINAEDAWDFEKGQNNILIGIIDTGISYTNGSLSHPDLDDATRYILGYDYVNSDNIPGDGMGHGTHVAGIAAAETDNSTGIAGMNWSSPVYICKVCDDSVHGHYSDSDFESAVEEIVDYAVNNNLKVVINFSAGGSDSQTIKDACKYVSDHGMLLCAASGNDNGSAVISPALHSADYDCVIAVGATDNNDNVANFSNVGPELTVVAPGVGIYSTFPTYTVNLNPATNYLSLSGTSMATPHVTGLASLIWSRMPKLTNKQVRDTIINTAVRLGVGNFDNSWGNGRINAGDAVAKAGRELIPVQLNLNFIDIPEGETQLRAIRIDVKSFYDTSFEMEVLPGAPFSMFNYSPPVTVAAGADYDTPRSVYLWVKYTGTHAGDIANGTAKVKCLDTNDVFDVNISANTIARPTCALMLVLDKSGSMLDPSGVGNYTREQILKYSTGIFINCVREKNGVGIVTFDQDSYDLLTPLVGPFGAPDDPFDPPPHSVAHCFR